ncbi:MAG: hypothetical protein ACO1OB_29220 [Archangium sp.]
MPRRLALLLALVALPALAQQVEPTPPPQPEVEQQQPPPPPPAEPFVPSYQQPGFSYAQTTKPADDVPRVDTGHRVRWGVSFNLGWHLPYHALGLGLEGRIGYQFNSVFSTYVTLGGHLGLGLGVGVTNNGASVSGTFIAHYTMGFIAEAFLGNHFYVAAGPAFGVGPFGVAGVSASSQGGVITGVVAYGFKPGFDARLGFAFGKQNPVTFRRGGFNIGVDVLTLYHPGAIYTRLEANEQGGSVEVQFRDSLWTVTPMLTLGYDAR